MCPAAAHTPAPAAANPVLVEVSRGGRTESRHRGAFAVCDAAGRVVVSAGDIETPVYPRSAYKLLQAIPLIESGAAERFDLGPEQLALSCASHSSEPRHIALVTEWLSRLDLGAEDLVCGAHRPSNVEAADAMVRGGEAWTRLHNNCSGKHTGFLSVARALGAAPAGYNRPDHPVQQHVRAVLAQMCDLAEAALEPGVDGCSAPNFVTPLKALATGFARVADPQALLPARRDAVERLRAAVMRDPFLTAGTGRADVAFIEALAGNGMTKVGAEGVFVGAVIDRGYGFAIKIEDGAVRAAECAAASILSVLDPKTAEPLAAHIRAPVTSWAGETVGSIHPSTELLDAFTPVQNTLERGL